MRAKNPRLIWKLLLIPLAAIASGRQVQGDNWPGWRGPTGDGKSTETGLPTQWSREGNVRWRVALPERGNSTPIVWGDRVFVTQPMEAGRRRTLMCLDRLSGDVLWQSGVDAVEMEPTHETNPYCSPSPATDGERVICWFGSSGLVAYDYAGKELWRRPLGPVQHSFGYGASPVIHGDLCFLNFGPGSREFAVAVNKRTGEIVWQHDAPKAANQPEAQGTETDIHGTWSTPIIADGQVIFCFRDEIAALEPQTGRQIWRCGGLGPQMKASPFAGEGVVVAQGGVDSGELAVRLGGSGDLTDTPYVLWRRPQANNRLGTGVIHEGHIYVNRRNGVVECMELATGNVVWEERHAGPGSTGDTWSSLILADGRLYAINQAADVFVIAASPEYRLIATNSLGEHTNSSVVASQGNLFIRTHEALWCIGQ